MPPPPPLTSAQIRAARALIRWSAADLANHCAVSVTTIRRAELMPSATALTRVNDAVIRQALEKPEWNSSMKMAAAQECGCASRNKPKRREPV
jgi:hypothetical protein